MDWQIPEDDHQGRGNERAEQQAVNDAEPEQHGTNREQGLRSDAATRERPLVGVATFRHRSPLRRYEFGFLPTFPAAGAPATAVPCRAGCEPGCAGPPW